MTTKSVVSQRGAARVCGVDESTIRRAIESGELLAETGPRPKSPSRIRIADLRQWAEVRGLTLRNGNGAVVDPATGEVLEDAAPAAPTSPTVDAQDQERPEKEEAPSRPRTPRAVPSEALEQLGELRGVLDAIGRCVDLEALDDRHFRDVVRAVLTGRVL